MYIYVICKSEGGKKGKCLKLIKTKKGKTYSAYYAETKVEHCMQTKGVLGDKKSTGKTSTANLHKQRKGNKTILKWQRKSIA